MYYKLIKYWTITIIYHFQSDAEMPTGMASLLTAPLVADSIAEDSVSFSTDTDHILTKLK